MDFRDSPDEATFRSALREWIDDNLPSDWRQRAAPPGTSRERISRQWSKQLYEAGYAGLNWPQEFGGAEAPPTYQAILFEELAFAGAPPPVGIIGLGLVGPTLIDHGIEEQKERHLKKILTSEDVWCQGFSEPGAGSDLASLRTKAEDKGDHFLVNGQKVWSSFAHIADYCILLARTDPDAPKRAGITYFLLDMKSEGVETRPLKQMTGDAEFNEIFLTDVTIPRDNVVGSVNDGWKVAMTTLLHERATLGFALSPMLEARLHHVMELANEDSNGRRAIDDPLLRDRLTQEWINVQALKFTNYRTLTTLLKQGVPGPEVSVGKITWSETNQRLTKLALEMLGRSAQLDDPDRAWNGFWQHAQLESRGDTILGGTSEIQRSLIAERVLGLPRSR